MSCSKQFDDETGLYYYGARYMNPVTNIWYGVDPLAEKYKSIGAYVYCSANPIRLIDSDGKKILFVNGYWNSFIGGLLVVALLEQITGETDLQ